MRDDIKYEWDGDKLKRDVVVPTQKFTPKEVLDSIQGNRNAIEQMKQQKAKLTDNLKKLEADIVGATEQNKQLEGFEEQATELCLQKLKDQIFKATAECKVKALADAEKTIAADPSAYTEDQKSNMAYVNFQRLLATHEKIANKIPAKMIQESIFMNPIFDNPFLD